MSGGLAAERWGYTQTISRNSSTGRPSATSVFAWREYREDVKSFDFSPGNNDKQIRRLKVHLNGVGEESTDHLSVSLGLLSSQRAQYRPSSKFGL